MSILEEAERITTLLVEISDLRQNKSFRIYKD